MTSPTQLRPSGPRLHGGLSARLWCSTRFGCDSVRMRLLEIGEAVKGLSEELTAREPAIPCRTIARSRDNLAHHYFATELQIVEDTIKADLAPLDEAVARLIAEVERPRG